MWLAAHIIDIFLEILYNETAKVAISSVLSFFIVAYLWYEEVFVWPLHLLRKSFM